MTHWGWYWKIKNKAHNPKLLCSDLPIIDSFALFKAQTTHSFRVPGYQLKGIPEEGKFKVYYGKNNQPAYSIPIEKQKCHYGGYRYYFKCPLCHQRIRKLYFSNGTFLCRKCLNLGYYSQRLRPTKRYQYKCAKIENFITDKGGIMGIKKPPHMKNKTYQKLKEIRCDYQEKSNLALEQELHEWYK